MTSSKLLLDERPLQVLPQLAVKIGLNEAIALQQLHFHVINAEKKSHIDHFYEGRWWVYNSYAQWRDNDFPFWSESTIKRIFLKLENLGLALSNQLSKNKSDRKKWYSIDYEKLANIDSVIEVPHRVKLIWSSAHIAPMHRLTLIRWMGSDCPDGYTESPRESTDTKDSSTAVAAELLDHDEPDGTSPSMIENQYKVKPGQDWLQPILEKKHWDDLVLAFQEVWPEFEGAPDNDGRLLRIVNFCLGKLVNPKITAWLEFQPKLNFITPQEVRWLPVWYKQTYPEQGWLSQPDVLNKYFRLLRVAIKNGWRPGQGRATNGAPNAEAYQASAPASGNVTALDEQEQRRQVQEYLKRSA